MNNKEPKLYYDKEQDILYIDKDTYDRDVMTIYERQQKAIELLKEAGCYDEEAKTFCDDIWEELPKLLNILQGDDVSENKSNE